MRFCKVFPALRIRLARTNTKISVMSWFPKLSGFLLLLASLTAQAQTPYPDPKDESAWPGQGPIRVHPWMEGNRKAFWSKREKDQGAVVFVGSSMMGNWKTLAKDFPELKVANRGIGGDVSRGLVFRFQEDVLDLNPRAIVLAIGSNDLSAHASPAGIAANIEILIDQARATRPGIPLLLCPVAPRDGPSAPLRPGAQEDLNARLVALGKAKNIPVADLRTPFSDAQGRLAPEFYTADRIHFSAEGYRKLAEVIRGEFLKMKLL
jgi:lysophospholipase L1-like esterase